MNEWKDISFLFSDWVYLELWYSALHYFSLMHSSKLNTSDNYYDFFVKTIIWNYLFTMTATVKHIIKSNIFLSLYLSAVGILGGRAAFQTHPATHSHRNRLVEPQISSVGYWPTLHQWLRLECLLPQHINWIYREWGVWYLQLSCLWLSLDT